MRLCPLAWKPVEHSQSLPCLTSTWLKSFQVSLCKSREFFHSSSLIVITCGCKYIKKSFIYDILRFLCRICSRRKAVKCSPSPLRHGRILIGIICLWSLRCEQICSHTKLAVDQVQYQREQRGAYLASEAATIYSNSKMVYAPSTPIPPPRQEHIMQQSHVYSALSAASQSVETPSPPRTNTPLGVANQRSSHSPPGILHGGVSRPGTGRFAEFVRPPLEHFVLLSADGIRTVNTRIHAVVFHEVSVLASHFCMTWQLLLFLDRCSEYESVCVRGAFLHRFLIQNPMQYQYARGAFLHRYFIRYPMQYQYARNAFLHHSLIRYL